MRLKSIGTHCIAFYVNGNNIIYFDSFGVDHIPKEVKKFIGNKNTTNIYRIQVCDSKRGYFSSDLLILFQKEKVR